MKVSYGRSLSKRENSDLVAEKIWNGKSGPVVSV